jgi:hypothetical protein
MYYGLLFIIFIAIGAQFLRHYKPNKFIFTVSIFITANVQFNAFKSPKGSVTCYIIYIGAYVHNSLQA